MSLGFYINHLERLNRDTLYELRSIVARYPYFQTARLLMLNNMYLLHEPDFGSELRRSVLYVADRRSLWRLIEGYSEVVEVEKDDLSISEAPDVDRTLSLIDAFLETVSDQHDAISLTVGTPEDYMSHYLNDNLTGEQKQSCISYKEDIDSNDSVDRALVSLSSLVTVEKANTSDNRETQVEVLQEDPIDVLIPEESLDESYFTETLAKIYIKQHKYSRALEIIRTLYLQFPEKNAYFADQIRFLEKLIINNKLK